MSTEKPDEPRTPDLFKNEETSEGKTASSKRKPGDGLRAAKERAAAVQKEAQKTAEIRLKAWGEEVREAPNEALRSALFTARNRNTPREQMKNIEVVSYGNSRLIYSGEELRQDDLDVWFQVVHLAREAELGHPICFSPLAMKKDLKMPYGKKHTERLKNILTRLKATAVAIHSERLGRGVVLSLIRKFEYSDDLEEDNTGRDLSWVIELEPEIAKLFGGGFYSTRIEWEQRLSLKGNLAKWMHGFYASHSEPYDLKVETLIKSAGSRVSSIGKARQMIREALDELKRSGFLLEGSIDAKDKVVVKRRKNTTSDPA
ncbi:hypothetical protein OU5_P0357 (plasmid) [Pseudomonas mandelii JR-1]|uniref:TrfA family protein n=2 Tax=Pseudomonas TaxID=286 RepID=A0A024EL25_9PSED|nr:MULTISPECIES: plasmid replication initiator TrfA [Pseudomonas]AHZ73609.1 hypothetical protein OU5_P0357 [Pseudomonas mandelii JR-1]MBC2384620.1 TrfA family protein [Pseudomonas cremoris]MBV7514507.1 hypothetical protein [Pseudomonas sp. PDM25]MDY7069651.1 Plasmid replication initiator protein TrfA [Pseudomonas extremaustralis]